MKQLEIFILSIIIFSLSSQCTRDKSTITGFETQANSDTLVARKPNIYIYPEEKINLKIEISFPLGGQIITSEPTYSNSGWDVIVDTTGLIDETFQYLFYECKIPNYFQTNEGWKVHRKNLEAFFIESLNKFGLNEKEILDFNEYWLQKLNGSEYYLIYPQNNEIINQLIELNFSKQPQTLQRIFYLFKETDNSDDVKMKAPQYNDIQRDGFTIIEWGGMVDD